MHVGCFFSLLAAWGLVCVLLFLRCWSALVGRLCVLGVRLSGPERHTPKRREDYERGPITPNGSTLARPKAAGNGIKHPTRTRAAETRQHKAPNSPKHNLTNCMRLHPETRERSYKRTAPTASTEAQEVCRPWNVLCGTVDHCYVQYSYGVRNDPERTSISSNSTIHYNLQLHLHHQGSGAAARQSS